MRHFNPLYSCSVESETKMYLMNIDSSLPSICDEKLLDLLLYGNGKFDTKTSQNILVSTLKFMNDSHSFDNLLF